MAEGPRYPKRRKTVPYDLELYSSGEDFDKDLDENDVENAIDDSSEFESEDEIKTESYPSLMDHSDIEVDKFVARDGTIWSEVNIEPITNFPIDHQPSLTAVSQTASTMQGKFYFNFYAFAIIPPRTQKFYVDSQRSAPLIGDIN